MNTHSRFCETNTTEQSFTGNAAVPAANIGVLDEAAAAVVIVPEFASVEYALGDASGTVALCFFDADFVRTDAWRGGKIEQQRITGCVHAAQRGKHKQKPSECFSEMILCHVNM